MTRFKELRRIESAIENADEGELQWALSYSESRLKVAHTSEHIKHWRSVVERIRRSLARVARGEDE